MGTIIGCCGCDISQEWDDVIASGELYPQTCTMDFTCDPDSGFVRCVSYGAYCRKCRLEMYKAGVILETEKDVENWLSGKTPYPLLIED